MVTWVRCENSRCGERVYARQFEDNLKVCPRCGHHARLSADERIQQLVDCASFIEYDAKLSPADPLRFQSLETGAYRRKLRDAQERTGLRDAAVSGCARIGGKHVEVVALEFGFLGASMGVVVGEKIARAAERAIEHDSALVTVCASGGARMQEGAFALLQMAKTVTALQSLAEFGIPYVSVLTDPTFGGVTASFAALGDVVVAEHGALIGFAGPRVIEQVTKEALPEGAQRADFLLQHGMVDVVVRRHELRPLLARLLNLYAAVARNHVVDYSVGLRAA